MEWNSKKKNYNEEQSVYSLSEYWEKAKLAMKLESPALSNALRKTPLAACKIFL